ncbi:uncharacterized protein J3R85_000984 [Psidium guajava]|nr:uncharacterized protein J3R85_000984 [Psidium guajava]
MSCEIEFSARGRAVSSRQGLSAAMTTLIGRLIGSRHPGIDALSIAVRAGGQTPVHKLANPVILEKPLRFIGVDGISSSVQSEPALIMIPSAQPGCSPRN